MHYLRAAASSDGSQPDGTVYLLENPDIRSKTRQPLFPVTLAELARRGRKGEVLDATEDGQDGILPIGKSDVIGAVVGFHSFDWEEANSRLLPGAIADSLTSFGGDFDKAEQTKLTEFLAHGAAGSSGTVTEPYSFLEKFPVPMIHAYYADGCSLAEAFYQSVRIPYQLVIVGDPLARPFASFASVKIKSPRLTRSWSGTVTIEPDIEPAPGKAVRKVEFWVDGQYKFDAPVTEALSWDTRTAEDGRHDIRLVAIEDSEIETRSSSRFLVHVSNNGHRIEVDDISQPVRYGEQIDITGTAPGAERVEIIQGARVLGSTVVKGPHWGIRIPASTLGMGPVSFSARAWYRDGSTARSDAVALSVGAPDRLLPALPEGPPLAGLSAVAFDRDGNKHDLVIDQLDGRLRELRKQRVRARQLRLSGFFQVTEPGFYQLAVAAGGRLRLHVNDQPLLDQSLSSRQRAYVPLSLDEGWYKLDIDLLISGRQSLKVVLAGDQPAVVLGGSRLRHALTRSGEH
jgi:hypothetical protein